MIDTSKILQVQIATDCTIWVTRGTAHATSLKSSDLSLLEEELRTTSYEQVRMLGTSRNAAGIVWLHARLADSPSCQLMIASPDICFTQDELDNPVISLNRMRQCLRPASLGGFHRCTEHDMHMYRLVLVSEAGLSDNTLVTMATKHPAWHDLSFVSTLNPVAAAKLLACIVDPRWYINMDHPTRLSKLKMYLGLTPANIQRWRNNENATSVRVKRCGLVLSAWGAPAGMPTNADMRKPGNFIWRRAIEKDGELRGLLRGCSMFISYCVHTWHQQIASTTSGQQIEFFLADAMFDAEECKAYAAHNAKR